MDRSVRVVCLVGSRKPPRGTEGRSASREMLRAVASGVADAGAEAAWLDLRELEIPWFDGRDPGGYDAPDLASVERSIKTSDAVILSVPAYWGGPSGVLKNLFDVLGGAVYDHPEEERQTCFTGKLVGLLVVGVDERSAQNAATDLRGQLAALGAWVPPKTYVLGNPRGLRPDRLLTDLCAYGQYMVNLTRQWPFAYQNVALTSSPHGS